MHSACLQRRVDHHPWHRKAQLVQVLGLAQQAQQGGRKVDGEALCAPGRGREARRLFEIGAGLGEGSSASDACARQRVA